MNFPLIYSFLVGMLVGIWLTMFINWLLFGRLLK